MEMQNESQRTCCTFAVSICCVSHSFSQFQLDLQDMPGGDVSWLLIWCQSYDEHGVQIWQFPYLIP